MNHHFSWQRMFAVINKEFILLRRDKLAVAMLLLLPIVELIIFGFAINSNPHHLPTTVINADHSPITRTLVAALETSDYFRVIDNNASDASSNHLIKTGKATFAVNIPDNFTRDLIRGDQPSILVTADATDPMTSVNALAALQKIWQSALDLELRRGLSYLIPSPYPFDSTLHLAYNPENITQYSIVPGLMGVVLNMTMVLITALAITREKERGTMENLLATPTKPIEVMIGKILPYVSIGYLQIFVILCFALGLFKVPFNGSLMVLLISALPFIAANLTIGLTFSTISTSQLQALQMTIFYFLPSLLLSGFLFPFYGMPVWAQWVGNLFPLTHFLIIARGIMIKGNGFIEIWPQIWPLILFTFTMLLIGFKRYKRTLD